MLLLVGLLALAPLASAHGGFDAGAPLGDASLHVRIDGAPLVVARAPLRLDVATDLPLPLEARLVEPSGAAGAWFALRSEGELRRAEIVFASPGAWRVDVRGAGDVASVEVPVWPAGPAFVEPASEATSRGVLVSGRSEPVAFTLVDAAHRPLAPPADVRARVEGPEGGAELPLTTEGERLVLHPDWTTPGIYTLALTSRSLGLDAGSRPPTQMLVVAPEEADVYGLEGSNEVPWGALAIPAALLALLLQRRLTRGRP